MVAKLGVVLKMPHIAALQRAFQTEVLRVGLLTRPAWGL
jgi:hypothetical protein